MHSCTAAQLYIRRGPVGMPVDLSVTRSSKIWAVAEHAFALAIAIRLAERRDFHPLPVSRPCRPHASGFAFASGFWPHNRVRDSLPPSLPLHVSSNSEMGSHHCTVLQDEADLGHEAKIEFYQSLWFFSSSEVGISSDCFCTGRLLESYPHSLVFPQSGLPWVYWKKTENLTFFLFDLFSYFLSFSPNNHPRYTKSYQNHAISKEKREYLLLSPTVTEQCSSA